jgi:hypothetical protein
MVRQYAIEITLRTEMISGMIGAVTTNSRRPSNSMPEERQAAF